MDLETVMALLGLAVGLAAVGYLCVLAAIREIELNREYNEEVQIRTPLYTNNMWCVKEAERIINDHLTKKERKLDDHH